MSKVAIITGAAKAKGIGKATALRLARDGMRVVVCDILGELAQEAARDIESRTGMQALAVEVDVTSKEQVDQMAAKVLQHFGRIDVLVNNAGSNGPERPEHFWDYTPELWYKLLDINLMSTVYCCQAVLPTMCENRGGCIVNIASMAAHAGSIYSTAPYAASKAAVANLTKTLAGLHGKWNITVNTVAPGGISTDMTTGIDYNLDAIPLGRMGKAEEIASAISFLAGPDGAYITGSCLDVNGGWRMR